jgi:outer membrane protein OmpA-like peptidoglycan-associated protein
MGSKQSFSCRNKDALPFGFIKVRLRSTPSIIGIGNRRISMTTFHRISAAMVLFAFFATGCAEDDPYRKTKIGAAIGAGAGAAIDKNNRARGAAIGGAVGILAGGGVGLYMDKQKKAIEEKLAKELKNHDVELTKLPDNIIQVDLKSEASFAINSSEVKTSFNEALTKLGGVIKEYDSTAVHVIGHTDSQGSTSYNQQLSQARATARRETDECRCEQATSDDGRARRKPAESLQCHGRWPQSKPSRRDLSQASGRGTGRGCARTA